MVYSEIYVKLTILEWSDGKLYSLYILNYKSSLLNLKQYELLRGRKGHFKNPSVEESNQVLRDFVTVTFSPYC